jgi:hypothetical protein
MEMFTTIGPVEFEKFTLDAGDTVPNPGDALSFYITLTNKGSTGTAKNLNIKLGSLDELVAVSDISRLIYNIPAGGSSKTVHRFSMIISPDCPVNTELAVQVNIYSFDRLCWTDTFTVEVHEPVSIAKNESIPSLHIFPNPSEDFINIEFGDPLRTTIEIYNIMGRRLYNNVVYVKTEKIDVSTFIAGVYLIKIKQDDKIYIDKVIVR